MKVALSWLAALLPGRDTLAPLKLSAVALP